MTTINASATGFAWKRTTIAASIIVLVSALAGCSSSGSSLLEQVSGGSTEPAVASRPAQPAATTKGASRAKIAIAPVIGAPDAVARQLSSQLSAQAKQHSISVAKSTDEKVDYMLRGYIVAARETSGTKVSYIWDVTNPKGARVHRITGEELVGGAGAGDPWQSVSSRLIQTIAVKTGASLNNWLPKKNNVSAPVRTPVAAVPQTRQRTGTGTGTATATATPQRKQQVASRNTRALTPPAGTGVPGHVRTGSITQSSSKTGAVNAVVPRVTGAPGDGASSLSKALQQELARNGVKSSGAGRGYRVEGRVAVGTATAGQQPIKIDWVVKDPKGRSLGTVSQENKIPAGSLDGAWGPTANAAAIAAAQGILKLIKN